MPHDHSWVKHTLTPIQFDEDGEVIISQAQLRLAEEHAVYGCGVCDIPFSEEDRESECTGRAAELTS